MNFCGARHREPALIGFITCERERHHDGPHIAHLGGSCFGSVVTWL